MLYDITAEIAYDYDAAASSGRHVVRLIPADIPGEQRTVVQRLSISPRAAEQVTQTDFFGNRAVDVRHEGAHDHLAFRVKARVERLALPPTFDVSARLKDLAGEIAQIRSLDAESPHHFLASSPRVADEPAITAYAKEQISPRMTALEAVRTLGRALHRDMRFDAEATTVDTPPAEAFERRHGVCQDFTHIMIGGLRGIGVPAAYVSGYLRTIPPEGKERLEGADAMHAWVRAWCGVDGGWVEYDPTNALMVGADHIVVGHGRDYADVSPVKGILKSSGSQKSSQAVDVVPVEGQRDQG
ncbi:MAG: transglutaminase family protein [Alphaproteobacteria bacterium]|nr:transglutaminase family protein [Alphaproteobacteria bacterium]